MTIKGIFFIYFNPIGKEVDTKANGLYKGVPVKKKTVRWLFQEHKTMTSTDSNPNLSGSESNSYQQGIMSASYIFSGIKNMY